MNVAEFIECITCNVVSKCKKYATYTNYVSKLPAYDSTFTLTTG